MSQPSDPAWVAWDSASAGTGTALFEGPAPALVSFAPPARQSRLTIAVRLLLAIPHLVIVVALAIAALFVTFIAWFAALFAGRLPEWAHTFMTGALRWEFRAEAYSLFLTDKYPPFSLEDDDYPVRLVTARTRLNRFTIFFRIILLIPGRIMAVVAEYGLLVVSFFVWLIALVYGRLPQPLHQALAAIVRLQARYTAYFQMLTPEQPWWGLYGDPAAGPVTAPGSAADDGVTPAAPTDPWKLALSFAAQMLVTLILVLGALAAILVFVVRATQAGHTISNAQSLVAVGEAYNKVASSSSSFEKAVQACGSLSCVTAQDSTEATALRAFASSVSSAGVTGSASADANSLVNDANGAAQSLDKLAASTTVAQYQSEVSATGLQQQLNSLDADYTKLVKDLTA